MTPGLYRTRSGHKARVLCNDAPGPYPNVGYIFYDDVEWTRPEAWDDNGFVFAWNNADRRIIGPWEEAT